MKRKKLGAARSSEVDKLKGKKIKFDSSRGGFYQTSIQKTKNGFMIYRGGGTPSEPIYRLEFEFETLLEARLYLIAECLKEDLDEI